MNVIELELYISFATLALLALYMNRNIKHIMWTSVKPGQGKWILANALQLTLLSLAVNISMMNLPLTLVAATFCVAPFLSVIAARFLLGEAIPAGARVRMVFAGTGAFVLIFNTPLEIPA